MLNAHHKASRSDDEVINDLILELSLVTAMPINAGGRNLVRASAAATALGNITSKLDIKELRKFEWTVEPLVRLLLVDIDDPLAAKTAYAIRTLMNSRVCMTKLIETGGLADLAKVLDIMCSKRTTEMKGLTIVHSLVENLAICYREIARFHNWKLVEVGGLRHCVALLRYGDVTLQTIATMTMASLSNDLDICKQMFSYGAVKPLLNVSDATVTNDACMLAGLGCITQLCRIQEIAMRLVQTGVVPVLEMALHRHEGHNHVLMREKSLFALGFLSRIDKLKAALCTQVMLDGLMHEFHTGTMGSKTTVLQLLLNVHGKYPQERGIALNLRDSVLHLLKTAPWTTRNLCLKVFCVVYREVEDLAYFAHNGLIESIFWVIDAKDIELQEAPLVALLHLCEHPQLPFNLIRRGVLRYMVKLLRAHDNVIQQLSLVLLKLFYLYNEAAVMKALPPDKHYLMSHDAYNPQYYGAEYGEMIQEYLQQAVGHRQSQDYLINQFSKDELDALQLEREELVKLQNTFMEVDLDCSGTLSLDELKMLMVVLGEVMDKDELQELLEEYDSDQSGELDFKEFVIMMKGWDTRFGSGLTKLYNQSIKRGPIGKFSRSFKKWWNRDRLEEAMVQEAKERRLAEKNQKSEMKLAFSNADRLAKQREIALQLREEEKHHGPMHHNLADPDLYQMMTGSIRLRTPLGGFAMRSSSSSLPELLPPPDNGSGSPSNRLTGRRGSSSSAISHLTDEDDFGSFAEGASATFPRVQGTSQSVKRRGSASSSSGVLLPPLGLTDTMTAQTTASQYGSNNSQASPSVKFGAVTIAEPGMTSANTSPQPPARRKSVLKNSTSDATGVPSSSRKVAASVAFG